MPSLLIGLEEGTIVETIAHINGWIIIQSVPRLWGGRDIATWLVKFSIHMRIIFKKKSLVTIYSLL